MTIVVSVLTPTYNRKRFVTSMVTCYKNQTYPKESMEWIVLDDGTEKIEKEFLEATKGLPNIRYISLEEKLTIGAKRNRLNQEARGEYLVSWDDDDYYSPERVAHAVKKMMAQPNYMLAGSSELYLYFKNTKTIYRVGPYHGKHATNGTFVVRSSYAKSHLYDETVMFAEEKSFLENYVHPLLQLDPFKVMLVMCHDENTFNKDKIVKEENKFVKKTSMKIKNFIKEASLRSFFE